MNPRLVVAAVVLAGASAQPLRAQHPGGSWRTIETAHFRTHVRPAMRALGLRAAAEAERAWAALAAELRAPTARVDLVVSDASDEANGFASVLPVPTIVVFAAPPAGDVQLEAYDTWLRLVITHELAHVFQLDVARGWWSGARRLFGRAPGLFPGEYAPTWLIEGLAVYYESRLTGAGREQGSFFRAVVTAAAAESGGVPIDAAGGLSPRWPAGIRPYALGASFLASVAAGAGDSAVPRMAGAIAGQAVPYLRFDRALVAGSGTPFTLAWRRWQDDLRMQPAEPPAPAERPVLCCLRTATVPHRSPDGSRLLLVVADGRDAPQLAAYDRRTGRLTTFGRVNSDNGVAWSGASMVVAQLDYTDPYTVRSDLSVMTGGVTRRLTSGARLREPDAHDGRIVAVRVVPGGNELVVLEAGAIRTLVPAAPGIEWAHPRFAPDGRHIAVTRAREGRHDIVLLAADGRVEREVTHDAVLDRTPVFSPDGAWLLWSRDVNGTAQVVGERLADAATFRLTGAPFGAYAPTPTADSLFYLSYHHDGFRLVVSPFAPVPWSPDTTAAPAPVAAPAPAIRAEHAYRPVPALWPHYWVPVIAGVGGGAVVGARSSGSDPVGRHAWLAEAGVGIGGARGRWSGLLVWRYARLSPAVIDVAGEHRPADAWFLTAGGPVPRCCVDDDQVNAGVSLYHLRWRTRFAARLGVDYDRFGAYRRAGVMLSGSASHLVRPPLAISPQSGWRVAATLRQRFRRDTTTESREAVVSGAVYVPGRRISFARETFVVRAAAGAVGGSDLTAFAIGGVSEGSYEAIPGVYIGGASRTFPVRGFPEGYLRARRAAALTLEVRSPLALIGRGPGLFPPVLLDRVSTALYADGAVSGGGPSCAQTAPGGGGGGLSCNQVIGSVGGEAVLDAGVPRDFPVRLRFGAAWRFGLRSGALYGAVGAAF